MSVKDVICGLIGWVKGWMVDKPEFVFLEGLKEGATVEFGDPPARKKGLVVKIWERGAWIESSTALKASRFIRGTTSCSSE